MGTVIRRESVSAAAMFSFADLERQARDILVRARAAADRLLAEAEVQARRVAQTRQAEGYQRGLSEGRQRGLEQIKQEARQAALQAAQAELTGLKNALAAGLAEYERQRHSLIAQAESGLIELAVAIARRACKVGVDGSAEPLRANIRALLEMVTHHGDIELHVNPAECELLADVIPGLAQHIAGCAHVTLTSDPAVARGGCVLQTSAGVIDASVDAQLDRIAAAIGAPVAAARRGSDAAEAGR